MLFQAVNWNALGVVQVKWQGPAQRKYGREGLDWIKRKGEKSWELVV